MTKITHMFNSTSGAMMRNRSSFVYLNWHLFYNNFNQIKPYYNVNAQRDMSAIEDLWNQGPIS